MSLSDSHESTRGVGSRENWLKSIFLFCLWRLNVVVRFELMLESRIGHLN